MPGCPSGQRERTVNPPALPSEVRILYLALVETPGTTAFRKFSGRRFFVCGRLGGAGSGQAVPGCPELRGAPRASFSAVLCRDLWIWCTVEQLVMLSQASDERHMPGVCEHAPLAQSAERFHGKEKVDSSILSGGSERSRPGTAAASSAGSLRICTPDRVRSPSHPTPLHGHPRAPRSASGTAGHRRTLTPDSTHRERKTAGDTPPQAVRNVGLTYVTNITVFCVTPGQCPSPFAATTRKLLVRPDVDRLRTDRTVV